MAERRGRVTDRAFDALRSVTIQTGYVPQAAGSALISMGDTQVICVASISEGVPPWLAGRGQGWLTAEYTMLPYATVPRGDRERGQTSGRSQEIRRLIGRSLRMAVDRQKLGERTLTLDCDVLRADGGTRTAAITGGYVAVAMALERLLAEGLIQDSPLVHQIAAVSVGLVDGCALLDLEYREDARADGDDAGEHQHRDSRRARTASRHRAGAERADRRLSRAERSVRLARPGRRGIATPPLAPPVGSRSSGAGDAPFGSPLRT